MIKQIKMGIRLLPYSHGIWTNIVMCGVIAFFGILASMHGMFSVMGIYLLMAAAMCPLQMLYSLGVSNMVQTSPWKKPIQTSISALMDFMGFSLAYLISFLLQLARISYHPEEKGMAANVMLMGGVVGAFMMMYMGVALKYFVTATMVFIAGIWAIMFTVRDSLLAGIDLPFGIGTVIGFGCLIVGAFLQYGVTLLVYKKPIAKQSQLGGLKKVM